MARCRRLSPRDAGVVQLNTVVAAAAVRAVCFIVCCCFVAVLSAAKTTFVYPLAGAGLFSVREDAVRISLHSIIDVVPSNI